MLLETREEVEYDVILAQIVKKLKSQGFENIRTHLEGYEEPALLVRQGEEDDSFTPDATATKNGRKYYFEVARRTKEEIRLVGKWKLLQTLAELKQGELQIFIPRENLALRVEFC